MHRARSLLFCTSRAHTFCPPLDRIYAIVNMYDWFQVLTSTGEVVHFRIKRDTCLGKLQDVYADKVRRDISSIR